MIFNHCVIKLAIQNALRFNNKFYSLKNTQNCIFNNSGCAFRFKLLARLLKLFKCGTKGFFRLTKKSPELTIVGNIK